VLQIGVQGPLQVEVDGALADLGGPRQRAVLRLLVGQGSSVSVDRLLTDLYEGAPPPSALSGLQAYLSHVRRTLEPHRAQRAAPTVLLTAPPGSAAAAGRRPGRGRLRGRPAGRGAAGGGHPSRAVAQLDAALARWRGEAYAEVAFEPWVVPEAVRLTEQRSRAQERRAELALTAQGGAAVVAELEALVRERPVREESWRLLALALYDAGRQGDALAALRRTR
jgi:DNA-binding SARP family transcriptional activator